MPIGANPRMRSHNGYAISGANPILVFAATKGLIKVMKCEMPICELELEQENGRYFFETCRGREMASSRKWAPSPDRYPIPARDGGRYVPENVRLAHHRCNLLEGSRAGVGSPAHLSALAGPANRARWNAVLAKWNGSPAQQAHIAKLNADPRQQARNRAWLAEWRASPGNHAHLAANTKKGNCTQWQINRGKPCICGQHDA